MAQLRWWTILTTVELLALRKRLLDYVTAAFYNALSAELEDVVQHAITVLFLQKENVQAENDGLFRYIKRVARNDALDRIRAGKVRFAHGPKVRAAMLQRKSGAAEASAASENQDESFERMWEVFCALDDQDRLIVWSYVVEEKSIRAVSDELGLGWHRVDGTVRRVLLAMQEALSS